MSNTSTSPAATVGASLANAVATELERGRKLAYSHPEFCGMGLHIANGAYIYCEVFDGDLLNETQYQKFSARGDAVEFMAFATREQFVSWLAAQSDASLAGHGLPDAWRVDNQRLSVQRLREFARP